MNLNKIKKNAIKIIGNDLANIIIEKIKNNLIIIQNKKEKEINNIIYSVFNYIDSVENSNYNLINNLNLNNIEDIWKNYLNEYKAKYSTFQFKEKNKIILDYRKNGIGYYWVDLEKLFCIESMIRMEDCGRVNYGNTTLELREQTIDSNISHMIIVYEIESGNIRQVKGKSNQKPPKSIWIWFYNFLCDTDYKINKYIPTYKPENDLKLLDFDVNEKETIYLHQPNLKPTNIL
jgi:hypothetical protein